MICEEGLALIGLDKIRKELAEDIRAVFILRLGSAFAVFVYKRPIVSGAFVPAEDRVLLKAHFGNMVGVFFLQNHLPFTRQSGRISGVFQDVAESDLIVRDVSPVLIVSKAVPAGQKFYARRSADRRTVTVREASSRLRELIDIRCFVRGSAIAAEHFGTDIVCHDEDDVGFAFS